jgi:putative transposase
MRPWPLLISVHASNITCISGCRRYQVVSSSNAPVEVLDKEGDDQAFADRIGDGWVRLAMQVIAYCLMPNHFHLARWPHQDGDLGR